MLKLNLEVFINSSADECFLYGDFLLMNYCLTFVFVKLFNYVVCGGVNVIFVHSRCQTWDVYFWNQKLILPSLTTLCVVPSHKWRFLNWDFAVTCALYLVNWETSYINGLFRNNYKILVAFWITCCILVSVMSSLCFYMIMCTTLSS